VEFRGGGGGGEFGRSGGALASRTELLETRLSVMQASKAAEFTPASWQAARQRKTLRQVA